MPQIQVTLDIPAEVVDAVNTWRLRQTTGDPPVLKYATNKDLLDSMLTDVVLRVLDQEPTVSMLAEKNAIETAKANIQAIKDNAVTVL